MNKRVMLKLFVLLIAMILQSAQARGAKHSFIFKDGEFLLDGKPFQIISGELHPARIPEQYWRHRIKMAKAMGCNTIAAYIFWNYHEPEEGIYDFTSPNHNIQEFIKIVQEEEMWLIIRPGPYVCAEWELGGIPPYLLRIPDIKLRSLDTRYMLAAERYIARLAGEIKPHLITKGGPVIMLQIENEYGSFGKDRNYMLKLREIWNMNGINIPTFTADGPSVAMLEAGSLPGSATGLDSGRSREDFDLAARINPGMPVFSSETYPGWLTHWGEKWARPDTTKLLKEVKFLMDNKKSFNIYVLHGGTSFGFTAGANSGGKGYEPDVTSYDYDAPVNEQGQPTAKYFALRNLISSYLPRGKKLPPVPDSVPSIEIIAVPTGKFTSIWDNLPQPVGSEAPGPFETYGQDYGMILYRTQLPGNGKGNLTVTELHDYATVFINDVYIGKLDRREGISSIELPESKTPDPVLDILVEGMGRINYGQHMTDRKGITEKVTLDGAELKNWKIYKLPLDDKFIYNLRSTGRTINKPGIFFKGNFTLGITGDTFFDMSLFTKGIVWVNGHNLGRYWNIGPQKQLYCPVSWIRMGMNEIIIFDLHQTEAKPVSGMPFME
jgi:beta-galactosidase